MYQIRQVLTAAYVICLQSRKTLMEKTNNKDKALMRCYFPKDRVAAGGRNSVALW